MAFDNTRFSESGLELLSEISSSKALKIKNIYCDTAFHSDADLDQDPFWWESQTATTMGKVDAVISALSPVEGQARVIIDLSLKSGQSSDVTVRTVIITACAVESGVEGDEVTFVGTTDSDGVEVIYRSGIKISTAISLYFKFSNASDITIDTGLTPNFVVHSELERFVSTHSVSSSVSGDTQSILGNKFFEDDLTVGSILKINDYDEAYGSILANSDDLGILFRTYDVGTGTLFAFSDYDSSEDADTSAMTLSKEKAGYQLTVEGEVVAAIFETSWTQDSVETQITQQGDKIRLFRDDGETTRTIALGFDSNGEFAISVNNDPVLEVASSAVAVDADLSVTGKTSTAGLTLTDDHAPGTIMLLYSANTGSMMTFGVGDSIDDPNRTISLSIFRDSIHAHMPLIAESGLQVTGWLQADAFYGDLVGCIPSPLNEYNVPKGSLCIIKVGRTSGLLRGAEIVKTAAPNVWSTVGASESFQITLASIGGDVAGVTPNLAIGDKFIILSSCGLNGVALAMRSE